MDLDVTSVDKQPEPYGEAPAALQVITNAMKYAVRALPPSRRPCG